MSIVLATLNARYAHASLGLRYLLANMGALQSQTRIREFVIGTRAADIVEKILADQPRIVGFGVYIWNVEETTHVVALLKRVAPDVVVVLGGPEVSYESGEQEIVRLADHVITGWGDISFPKLCQALLDGPKPLMKIIPGEQPPLDAIALPYALYDAEDIAHRTVYVEASRGCPFKCEFCLSSLDKTAWPFDIDAFLAELESLHARGARLFKFVDRTFNLNVRASLRILGFFLDKLAAAPHDPVFAHFELVPDHLPDALKDSIRRFPPGTLQLEIGIQTFNPTVQTLVSRRQNDEKAEANLRWLMQSSHAHLHVDLIAGLPGEDLESFARGFNRLVDIGPHEIQFGILKRLRGTPIIRHTAPYGLVFDSRPPYAILATDRIDFDTMQRLGRFARYWDLVANSGRFAQTLPHLLGTDPFFRFLAFSDWLYAQTDATHRIALERLAKLVARWLVEQGEAPDAVEAWLAADARLGREGHGKAANPSSGDASARGNVSPSSSSSDSGSAAPASPATSSTTTRPAAPERQLRHLAA